MISPGTRLGAYEITAKLGEGGMGQVWQAKDFQLGREVALKVLPEGFTDDPERLARFEREARLLAQLNHPNIAQIYGMEASGETRALVMELVEGPTLADRLEGGSLPLGESLSFALQIAQALEEAHEKGIVHRDLKPQNVKASVEGRIKVLDFGLAKAMDPTDTAAGGGGAGSGSQLAQSPTLTAIHGTQLGVILGTAAYMSPEQAKGLAVDKRADIWAFGVVLYEMLTGVRLFAADSVTETLAGVLKSEVDWSALPRATPPRLRRLIERCLVRDRRQRLHDIGDARLELEDLLAPESARAAAPPAARRARFALPVALGVVAGALVGAAAWRAFAPTGSDAPAAGPVRLSVVPPENLRLVGAGISPDGGTLVLGLRERADRQSQGRYYLRRLDRFEPVPVPESEGASSWSFSPDGRWFYFVGPIAAGAPQLRLARAPVEGGAAAVTVRRWADDWVTWTLLDDGDVLVTTMSSDHYLRLPAGGGEPGPEREFEGDLEGSAFFGFTNERLPDGSPLLNVAHYGELGFQLAAAALDPESGRVSRLVDDASRATLLGRDRLLFGRGSSLLVAPFDAARRRVTDAPRAVLDGVRTVSIGEPYPRFAMASNGTLAYVPGSRLGSGRRLAVVGSNGAPALWSEDRRPLVGTPSIAANGRIAVTAMTPDGLLFEIWLAEPGESLLRRVVSTPGVDNADPVLSRDGTRFAFSRLGRTPDDGLYVREVDGGTERRLAEIRPETRWTPLDWWPDGRLLLAERLAGGNADVVLLEVDGPPGAEPRPLLAASGVDESQARVSPDGRTLAFVTDETGKPEVYVAPLGPDGLVGAPLRVSDGSGSAVRWRPDGRALLFWDGQDQIFSVPVQASQRIVVGRPEPLLRLQSAGLTRGFDVMPDGRLLFVAQGEEEGEAERIDVVIGFGAELAASGAER